MFLSCHIWCGTTNYLSLESCHMCLFFFLLKKSVISVWHLLSTHTLASMCLAVFCSCLLWPICKCIELWTIGTDDRIMDAWVNESCLKITGWHNMTLYYILALGWPICITICIKYLHSFNFLVKRLKLENTKVPVSCTEFFTIFCSYGA